MKNRGHLKVLIVDDEKDLREVLSENLEIYGAVCLEAGNAQEAAEVLKKETVDVIISDIRMPGGDGRQLAEFLKSENITTPFYFMTGFADMTDQEAHQLGALKIFNKPFKFKEMRETLFQYAKAAS